MRRELITWSIALGVILAAFAGTVLVLNSTLYSAGGFVRGYLDAIARHDADGALELAGTSVVGDASRELLVPQAMGELGDIRLVNDLTDADGTHHVVYAWSAGGTAGQSTFDVRRSGTLLGLFPTWEFTSSPLGVIQLSVLHDRGFTANGLQLSAPQQDTPSPYLVFAPGAYVLSHKSTFLEATPVTLVASKPGAAENASVDVQANDAFVAQVSKELKQYLDKCATQQVLLPTGCPFGEQIANRITTTPVWSMSSYPDVTLTPGPEPASWLMPPTPAAAHITVDVKSLFDGTVSTLDEDVPFTSSYLVTFLPDGELYIKGQYQ